MEIALVLVVAVVIIAFLMNRGREFDDPKPMSNQQLLAAIAGQADWLEKMSRSPIGAQNSASIVDLAKRRRAYIALLCLEVVTRGAGDGGPGNQELKYPGASAAPNLFLETYEYAKNLEPEAKSREIAATRAVKQVLFVQNGVPYPTSWEV